MRRMKWFGFVAFCSVSVVLSMTSFTLAAPSLDITNKSITPVQIWTGPVHDANAIQGQWFLDMETGKEEPRTNEFYDNVLDFGGGSAGSTAIVGIPTNIQYNMTNMNLVGFDILATITNDVTGIGQWRDGTNSHNETLVTDEQYEGTLYDTKLTTEFAVDMLALNKWMSTGGALGTAPYTSVSPMIVAENPDELGWYCWTPENGQLDPYGDYLVPTYDFGDIKPGESVTRVLSFTVDDGGLNPNDPRYEILLSQQDIFLNRTSSLKISNWIEMLAIDNGKPYPIDVGTGHDLFMQLNSDVSVFHNVPEPSTIVLLTLMLGFGLLLKRRRK